MDDYFDKIVKAYEKLGKAGDLKKRLDDQYRTSEYYLCQASIKSVKGKAWMTLLMEIAWEKRYVLIEEVTVNMKHPHSVRAKSKVWID